MKYSKDVGVNWHLRFRLIIQELTEELELTQIHLNIAETKSFNATKVVLATKGFIKNSLIGKVL